MPLEVFVDESLRRDYLMAAVVSDSRELKAGRSALRAMLLGGERRIHFSKERNARRRDLLSRFCEHGFKVTVYVADAGPSARRRLLTTLVADAGHELHRLVLESRAEGDVEDQRLLIGLQLAGDFPPAATYEHLAPHEEPLLWVADGVACALALAARELAADLGACAGELDQDLATGVLVQQRPGSWEATHVVQLAYPVDLLPVDLLAEPAGPTRP